MLPVFRKSSCSSVLEEPAFIFSDISSLPFPSFPPFWNFCWMCLGHHPESFWTLDLFSYFPSVIAVLYSGDDLKSTFFNSLLGFFESTAWCIYWVLDTFWILFSVSRSPISSSGWSFPYCLVSLLFQFLVYYFIILKSIYISYLILQLSNILEGLIMLSAFFFSCRILV